MSFWIIAFGIFFFTLVPTAAGEDNKLKTRTLAFQGITRKFFVSLPLEFNPDKTYWLLVVVHGGGGCPRTSPKVTAMRRVAKDLKLPAIVVLPEFNTDDKQVSRFPALGEGLFLKAILKHVRADFKTHPKILLTGYSMGGQFTHRFALSNPDMVQACAPLAAGTWSTPDGKLLIESYGEVNKPKIFLSTPKNAQKVPERLRNLFDARTANIAGLPAKKGAAKVPFLIMCGTLDPRLSIAKHFVTNLQNAGFSVETGWPKTPHNSKSQKYRSEFKKFPQHVISFFMRKIGNK